MARTNCAVVNCGKLYPSSTGGKEGCVKIHGCNKGAGACVCEPLFRLLPFPTTAKSPERRQQWTNRLRRTNPNKKPGNLLRIAEFVPSIVSQERTFHRCIRGTPFQALWLELQLQRESHLKREPLVPLKKLEETKNCGPLPQQRMMERHPNSSTRGRIQVGQQWDPRCELRIGRVSESNRCYTVRKGLWEGLL